MEEDPICLLEAGGLVGSLRGDHPELPCPPTRRHTCSIWQQVLEEAALGLVRALAGT